MKVRVFYKQSDSRLSEVIEIHHRPFINESIDIRGVRYDIYNITHTTIDDKIAELDLRVGKRI